MMADAVNLLAEIRRLGGDVKLISCDKLRLVAPTALMPELAERVRAAKPMLVAVLLDDTSPAQQNGEGVMPPQQPCNSATLTGRGFIGCIRRQASSRLAGPASRGAGALECVSRS